MHRTKMRFGGERVQDWTGQNGQTGDSFEGFETLESSLRRKDRYHSHVVLQFRRCDVFERLKGGLCAAAQEADLEGP